MRQPWNPEPQDAGAIRGLRARLGILGLGDILGTAREAGYGAGDRIFERGDPPRHIYVVVSGAAQLSGADADRRVGVEVLRCGDLFGHNALLAGIVQPFDAHALEPTRLLIFPARLVCLQLEQQPDVLRAWLAWINEQVIRFETRLADTLRGPLEHRLARFLAGQAVRGELGLTQSELADMLGVHRGTVNRALKDLEEAGLISTGYRRIRVTDPEGLARLAKLPCDQNGGEPWLPVVDVRTRRAVPAELRLAPDPVDLPADASGA